MHVMTTMRHRWVAYRRWRGESSSTRDPQLIWYLLRRRGIRGGLLNTIMVFERPS